MTASVDPVSLNDLNFVPGGKLGKGFFGEVRKVTRKADGETFALKIVPKHLVTKHKLGDQMDREIRILYSLQHKNIIRLHFHFEDHANFYLGMEFAAGGGMFQRLKRAGRFTPRLAAYFFSSVCDALIFLHERPQKIVHRDLKPENILLDADDMPKLADFGWSNFLTNAQHLRQTFCGTLDYLAPEMIKGEGHDQRLDCWSLGVLLFEFLAGRAPFAAASQEEVCRKILRGDLRWSGSIDDDAKDLIARLLRPKPRERISVQEARRHRWVETNLQAFRQENETGGGAQGTRAPSPGVGVAGGGGGAIDPRALSQQQQQQQNEERQRAELIRALKTAKAETEKERAAKETAEKELKAKSEEAESLAAEVAKLKEELKKEREALFDSRETHTELQKALEKVSSEVSQAEDFKWELSNLRERLKDAEREATEALEEVEEERRHTNFERERANAAEEKERKLRKSSNALQTALSAAEFSGREAVMRLEAEKAELLSKLERMGGAGREGKESSGDKKKGQTAEEDARLLQVAANERERGALNSVAAEVSRAATALSQALEKPPAVAELSKENAEVVNAFVSSKAELLRQLRQASEDKYRAIANLRREHSETLTKLREELAALGEALQEAQTERARLLKAAETQAEAASSGSPGVGTAGKERGGEEDLEKLLEAKAEAAEQRAEKSLELSRQTAETARALQVQVASLELSLGHERSRRVSLEAFVQDWERCGLVELRQSLDDPLELEEVSRQLREAIRRLLVKRSKEREEREKREREREKDREKETPSGSTQSPLKQSQWSQRSSQREGKEKDREGVSGAPQQRAASIQMQMLPPPLSTSESNHKIPPASRLAHAASSAQSPGPAGGAAGGGGGGGGGGTSPGSPGAFDFEPVLFSSPAAPVSQAPPQAPAFSHSPEPTRSRTAVPEGESERRAGGISKERAARDIDSESMR